MGIGVYEMKPLIQIDDEVREMTDEEYEALLASGWTLEPAPVDEPVTEEPPALEEEAGEA